MYWWRRLCRTVCYLSLAPAVTGCTRSTSPAEPVSLPGMSRAMLTPASPAPAKLRDTPDAYPHGAWRLAAPGDLDRTVLWLSHILIRHDQVESLDVPFNITGWVSTQPPTTRTRKEALALAESLAETARQQGNFDELARRYSEDPERRSRGGSLGGVVALHLAAWPSVLDAVATLRPGDISNVVSTEYGYHVLARRPPAPEATVSGAHIVIAHAGAPWIQVAGRHEIPERSRDEAFAIAAQLYDLARGNAAAFPQLVASHSDHRDAARGGDMGSWSTREPSGYPREIETLAQLEVGEVAEPIDSLFGVQVIVRTPNRVRERYAATQIYLRFDANAAAPDAMSKGAVLSQARGLIDILKRDPTRFRSFQEESCCTDVLEIIEGRHAPDLVSTLASLASGQIADTPVEDATRYTIPKRLELSALPRARPIRFDLPDAAEAPLPARFP
jgi:PPIC-type peptidyl-prolyl cis-trans isomerase-like protein